MRTKTDWLKQHIGGYMPDQYLGKGLVNILIKNIQKNRRTNN